MNVRERFLATLAFEPGVRPPLWEFAYWGGTIERWYGEGLPRRKGFARPLTFGEPATGPGAYWGCPPLAAPRAEDVSTCLGLDGDYQCVPLENWVFPPFKEEILADEGDNVIFRDKQGVVMRKRKDDASRPGYLSWPVSNRRDWQQLKEERFQVQLTERLPSNWKTLVDEYKRRDYPMALGGFPGGYFGSLRYLMGEMRLLTAYYDEPDLVHDIADSLTDFWIELYGAVLQDVQVDTFEIWEDMCYKAGPLISPATFREFMSPYYERLIGFLRQNGIRNFIVDTDGDCTKLIPLFLEAGVTALLPFEVQAGMDIREVRREYPRLQILGGLDKRRIAEGKAAIEAELRGKVPFMLKHGGYVPYMDHLVPPEVSWEDFRYYRQLIAELVEEHCGPAAD